MTVDAILMIDAILLLVAIEFAVLAGLKLFRAGGPGFRGLAATLASGAFLLGATRAALSAETGLMMAMLAAAGIAHAIDMALRWRPHT